jgi:hypothetical protein
MFTQNLPVLRGREQPLLNVFGEPVKTPGPWLLQRLARGMDRSDPEALWLTQHKLYIPDAGRDITVGQWIEKADRPRSAGGLVADRYFRAQILDRISNDELTPEERTEFIKTTGRQIRKAIQVLRQRRGPVKQNDVNNAVGAIRRRAMLQLVK